MQIKARFLLFFYFLIMAPVSLVYPAAGIRLMESRREAIERRERAQRNALNSAMQR